MPYLLFFCLTFCALLPLRASAPDVSTHPAVHASAQSQFGRLYVSGHVRVPQITPAAHVDVVLLNADDQVLAHKTTTLHPLHRHPSLTESRRERFTVSFPLPVARETARVQVVFHNHSHRNCNDVH